MKLPPNWRDLPAGYDLDEIAAAAQGWTNITRGFYGGSLPPEGWTLWGLDSTGRRDEIPLASQNANAALRLPLPAHMTIITTTYADGLTKATAHTRDSFKNLAQFAPAPFALAYTRAWLTIQEEDAPNVTPFGIAVYPLVRMPAGDLITWEWRAWTGAAAKYGSANTEAEARAQAGKWVKESTDESTG